MLRFLKFLDIRATKVTEDGLMAIRDSLPKLRNFDESVAIRAVELLDGDVLR